MCIFIHATNSHYFLVKKTRVSWAATAPQFSFLVSSGTGYSTCHTQNKNIFGYWITGIAKHNSTWACETHPFTKFPCLYQQRGRHRFQYLDNYGASMITSGTVTVSPTCWYCMVTVHTKNIYLKKYSKQGHMDAFGFSYITLGLFISVTSKFNFIWSN